MVKNKTNKVKKKVAKKAPKTKKTVKKAVKKGQNKRVATKKKEVQKKKAPARKKAARPKEKVVRKEAVKPKKKAKSKKKAKTTKKTVSRKKTAAKKEPTQQEKAVGFMSEKRLPPPQSRFPSEASARQPIKKRKGKVKKLTTKELREYRQILLNLRDQVVDGISFLSGDNLNRSQRDASGDLSGYSLHMADQGTDNYDREFALNLVSSEQDILYEIDEAIRRIDAKTYGICELTGEPIERARLNVIPYARYSVAAQSEMERGKTRYRPFGPTLSHGG